jgi:sulfur carrier protein
MEIVLNGEKCEVAPGTRIAALVEGDGKGWAIARNGEVVRRGEWDTTELAAGDEIEIVKAVQGG